jgi:hypothetical protein
MVVGAVGSVRLLMPFGFYWLRSGMAVSPLTVPAACRWFMARGWVGEP